MLLEVLEATEARTSGNSLWIGILRNPKEMIDSTKGIDSATRQKPTAIILAPANAATQYADLQSEQNTKNNDMEDEENV